MCSCVCLGFKFVCVCMLPLLRVNINWQRERLREAYKIWCHVTGYDVTCSGRKTK